MSLPSGVVPKGDYPEMTEFMEAAMLRAGVKTVPELCERTGLNTARNQRDFYKWLAGENRPLVTNALPLMREVGMLSTGEDARSGAGVASGSPAPESTGAALAELTREIRSGFAKLARRLDRLEKQQPAAAPQVQPKRRRASSDGGP